MKRYTLTPYDTASGETQDVYDDFMRTTGATSVPIWLQSLGHNPALARAYWERAKGTLFHGLLPLPLKEMIVFTVSAANGARYCSACHAQSVLSLDKALTFDDLKGTLKVDGSLGLPAYYQSVVQFAGLVVADPNSVADNDLDALIEDGFSITEIGEIISVIDLATMFNIYTSSLKLDLDPEFRAIL